MRSFININTDKIEDGSLLIHCHAGISRSSAIALAVIARRLGSRKEEVAVNTLEHINPNCRPNKSIVEMTDEFLERDGNFIKRLMRRYHLQSGDF